MCMCEAAAGTKAFFLRQLSPRWGQSVSGTSGGSRLFENEVNILINYPRKENTSALPTSYLCLFYDP